MRRLIAYLAAALLLPAGLAAAQMKNASTPPHQEQLPSPLLEKPEKGDAQTNRLLAGCLLQFALGHFSAAETACSHVLILDPARADAFKLRGYTYLMQRRPDHAAADFRAALRLKPGDDQIVAGYGHALSDLGRYPEAAQQFRAALVLAPQSAAYWNGLCWAQAGSGEKLKEALRACNRALELQPGAAAPYNGRGLVNLRLKNFTAAIVDYDRSLATSPAQASARFGRGLARLWSGKSEGAQDIRAARGMDGDIDQLFIGMKLLPRACTAPDQAACPPAFPPVPASRPDEKLIVKAPALDRDLLVMAGLGHP